MTRATPRNRATVFVAAVVVVIVGSLVGPAVTLVLPPDRATYPGYESSDLVPDRPAAEGRIRVRGPTRDHGIVAIDASHGNRFETDALRPLVAAITTAGYRVEFVESAGRFPDAVRRADALVVIDPATPYSPAEADAVESFVDDGGRLLLFGEPTRGVIAGGGVVSARSHVGSLASRFGVEFGTDYLYDPRMNDGNYRNLLADGTDAALAARVDRAALYTATRVAAPGGRRLLVSSASTRSSRGDGGGPYPLAVRAGGVVAVGDASFLEGGNFRVADNDRLLSNLVSFLVSGDRTRGVLEYPYVVRGDATIRYTWDLLLPAARRLKGDLAAHGIGSDLVLDAGPARPGETDVLVTTFGYLSRHPRVAENAGVAVSDLGERVSVPGYSGSTLALVIVHAPESGYDLVIVSDTPERVSAMIRDLTHGEKREAAVSESTLVVKGDPNTVLV